MNHKILSAIHQPHLLPKVWRGFNRFIGSDLLGRQKLAFPFENNGYRLPTRLGPRSQKNIDRSFEDYFLIQTAVHLLFATLLGIEEVIAEPFEKLNINQIDMLRISDGLEELEEDLGWATWKDKTYQILNQNYDEVLGEFRSGNTRDLTDEIRTIEAIWYELKRIIPALGIELAVTLSNSLKDFRKRHVQTMREFGQFERHLPPQSKRIHPDNPWWTNEVEYFAVTKLIQDLKPKR